MEVAGREELRTPQLSRNLRDKRPGVHLENHFHVLQNLSLLRKFRSLTCRASPLAKFSFQLMWGHVFMWYCGELPTYSLKFHSVDSFALKQF